MSSKPLKRSSSLEENMLSTFSSFFVFSSDFTGNISLSIFCGSSVSDLSVFSSSTAEEVAGGFVIFSSEIFVSKAISRSSKFKSPKFDIKSVSVCESLVSSKCGMPKSGISKSSFSSSFSSFTFSSRLSISKSSSSTSPKSSSVKSKSNNESEILSLTGTGFCFSSDSILPRSSSESGMLILDVCDDIFSSLDNFSLSEDEIVSTGVIGFEIVSCGLA